MIKKEFRTWVILDTKTGKFRIMSHKNDKIVKSRLKSTEIPIDLTMSVDIPEQPILKAHGEIKLSQSEISEMVLSEMEDDKV